MAPAVRSAPPFGTADERRAVSARAGRARPQGGGCELAVWYLMRLTGLGLFVLALSHYLILHVLYDPAEPERGVDRRVRWSSIVLAGASTG